jgi:hypothetical protein
MQHSLIRLFLAATSLCALPAAAESFLVQNGEAHAEIVIAANPSRATRLAARELQTYIRKIAGAELAIGDRPSGSVPVKIFVGESSHTRQLGITAEGLEDGAYRIVSGKDWIAFIGDDTDFVPIEPWPRNNNDIASGKMQAAWNKITGKQWGYTQNQLHKHYSGPNSLFGKPTEQKIDKDGNINIWTFDERGSFNGVCGFLRDLGVRWYLPGELGEVVPKRATIALPKIDRTVTPDFPMRILNFRPGVGGREAMMWGCRLGLRRPFGRQAAHGLHRMTHNKETLADHPEWFALYGGKRHTEWGKRLNQLCYSNEELLQEAIRFAQAQFDHYDMDTVSIMPPDGYTAICQCELCAGQDTPERGYRGTLSDYVWDFVNRVAKEIAKSHPGKMISNCAYGSYTSPPTKIAKLEPNVQVIIVGGRRPTSEAREELKQLRADWTQKTDNPIVIFENYPFTGRGFYLPAYIPTVMGESINATKGISRGEDIWLTLDFGANAIGYNHFLIYFTARMYWGGISQDAVAMFDEYCQRFYGPAADPMRAFFSYSEEHWRAMETDGEKAGRALELFATAKVGVPDESVYGRRIRLIDNYLNGLRRKSVQLAQKRGPVPKLRLVGGDPLERIVVDGQLEDKAWREIAIASTGRMSELQTGRQPIFGTTFKAAWQGGSLFFAIRCEEEPGTKPNVTATKNGDQAMWYGDMVEILLNTDSHNYYQIAVNPAGALIDFDRGADRSNWSRWDSQAQVATHVGDGFWNVEIRIPITTDENDPLHLVIGRKPTVSLPWHINLCRQRIRETGTELTAFSPTGAKGFHETMKFAHFYKGTSHAFDADPSVTDYLIDSRAAARLLQKRKFADAQSSYLALATADKATDLQKSVALQQAALSARSVSDYPKAEELAGQIPLDSIAKTVRMENLLAQGKLGTIVSEYADEDFSKWPFWQAGAGAFARGRAYALNKSGEPAESDLQIALAHTSNPRTRTSILATMGHNRETNVKDDVAALEAYRQNYETRQRIGAAEEFRSLFNATRILTRQGNHSDALAAIRRIDLGKLKGFWRHTTLLVLGETLAAAGQTAAASKAYRDVVEDKTASAKLRENAKKQIVVLKDR